MKHIVYFYNYLKSCSKFKLEIYLKFHQYIHIPCKERYTSLVIVIFIKPLFKLLVIVAISQIQIEFIILTMTKTTSGMK
jgi:hypothetical protein